MTRRHVDLAVNKESREVLQLRWVIENSLQTYYTELGFTKVSTPIIVAKAGGAVARPFETVASEFQDRTLQLRIAPELFLKRLVVGGLGGVYEIGPVFRNEGNINAVYNGVLALTQADHFYDTGVDPTHNPEFTICEFYRPFASLKELIEMTESTFKRIVKAVELRREEKFPSLPAIEVEFKTPYRQLDFISTIESESGKKLPMLQGENALQELIGFCGELDIPLPAVPNVARLLEQLSEKYLEPQCIEPTFIIHHPAICSPLAKSFIDEATGQEVSARAELFINGREYVNCYEEENSPFEQRRKFEQQATRKSSAANAIAETAESRASQAEIDESYIEALEWGLPPTGGWGCGVDRLVMLFSGKSRIADVLPFGTLRNVVGAVSK